MSSYPILHDYLHQLAMAAKQQYSLNGEVLRSPPRPARTPMLCNVLSPISYSFVTISVSTIPPPFPWRVPSSPRLTTSQSVLSISQVSSEEIKNCHNVLLDSRHLQHYPGLVNKRQEQSAGSRCLHCACASLSISSTEPNNVPESAVSASVASSVASRFAAAWLFEVCKRRSWIKAMTLAPFAVG